MAYVSRHAEAAINLALSDTRIVIVNGARQSGKSTLVHRLIAQIPGTESRRLDRPMDLAAAHLDPDAFVRHHGLLVIDEIQRAPELILPIKYNVDDDPRPGRYLLTGSARLLGLRALPDALVGRTETIELWPFSQSEIGGTTSNLFDSLLAGEPPTGGGKTTRDEYFEIVVRGGFPEAVERTPGRRAKFFESYLRDLVDRDISQISDLGRRDTLEQLIKLLMGGAGQLFVPAHFARSLSIDTKTVEKYVGLFEEVFLIKRIPAWTNAAASRAIHTRKIIAVDSGLAADTVGRSSQRLTKGDSLAGGLLESFVLSETARSLPLASERLSLSHFRTKDGIEVDGVLESRDRRIIGLEVKASESVRSEDLVGLRYLQSRVGQDFCAGVVFYTGNSVRSLGDRLWAVPIDCLWKDANS